MIIVKIYLGISLELLWALGGQFSFRQFLVPAYTSQYLQAPSNVAGVNYRDFNLLHLLLPKWLPLFIWLLLFVGLFSVQFPQGGRGGLLFRLTSSIVLWGRRNSANKYHQRVCGEYSQCLSHTGFALTHSLCAFPAYTSQASGCSAGSGPWVACTSQV